METFLSKLINYKWLYEEYIVNNKSTREISKELNCGKTTLLRYLKKFNIKKDKLEIYNSNIKILTKDFIYNEYFLKRKSALSISKEVGCSVYTIIKFLRKFNFQLENRNYADSKKRSSSLKEFFKKNPKDEYGFKPKEKHKYFGVYREKHPAWKGGKTPLNRTLRSIIQYKQWRKFCLERDNFICQICGVRGGKLNVDHIKKFSIILNENNISSIEDALVCSELWDVTNGRTLCVKCHKNTKNFGNKKE